MKKELKICINEESRDFVERLLKMGKEEFKELGYKPNRLIYRTVYYLDDEIFINTELIATEDDCHIDVSMCKDNVIGVDILEREDSDNFETLITTTIYTLNDTVNIKYNEDEYIINYDSEKEVINMENNNGKVLEFKKGDNSISFKTLTATQKEAVYGKVGFGTYFMDMSHVKIETNDANLITKVQFDTTTVQAPSREYGYIQVYDWIEIEYLDDTNLKFTNYNGVNGKKIIGYIEISLAPSKVDQFGLSFMSPVGNIGRLLVKCKTREEYKKGKLYSRESFQINDSVYQPPSPINIEFYLDDLLVEKKLVGGSPYMGFGIGLPPNQCVNVYNNIDNTKGELLYSMEIGMNAPLDIKVFMGENKEGKDLLKILQEIVKG